jgi:hypothetical protein
VSPILALNLEIPGFLALISINTFIITSITAMAVISKEARRKGSFQDSYTLNYALRIIERHIHTRQVLSARCLFCIYIGRESKPGETRKRQPTDNSKDFKPPFRAELFRKHHERNHTSIWQQYQSTSNQDKSTFFDDYTSHANTLFAKFPQAQTSFTFEIDAPIVETIIGDMFFHPDDRANKSHANALSLFKRNDDSNGYKVTRDNSLQFSLIVDLVAAINRNPNGYRNIPRNDRQIQQYTHLH